MDHFEAEESARPGSSLTGGSHEEKGYTEEQSVYPLKQIEVGGEVAERCHKMGSGVKTYYHWKNMYSGMGVSKSRRLKELEEEEGKMKQIIADLTLDKHML